MCGIVGIIGKADVSEKLLAALRRLEYRGYDSAGLAVIRNGVINRRRAEGKLTRLAEKLEKKPLPGSIGIGHTRWATHGVPNEANAHPHATDKVALVHNGIIENYQELRTEIERSGRSLASDTDTEVVVHLITQYLEDGLSPEVATRKALGHLEGAFALAILFSEEENLIIATRRGSPLAIGMGDAEMFLGSDANALAGLTEEIIYLEEGDFALLSGSGVSISDENNKIVDRKTHKIDIASKDVGKAGFDHFMLKEIFEQPQVIGDTLHSFINQADSKIVLPKMPIDLTSVNRITISACGTAYYAALIAKYWIESLARIPVDIDIASEFRYREALMLKGECAIFVSQSGETADTLAALRYCKNEGQKILSIVNVLESTIARESDVVLQTFAGPEIGVASTKAFTTQLTVLAVLAIDLAQKRGKLTVEQEAHLVSALLEVPAKVSEVLNHGESLKKLSHELALARDVLYLGRGISYPIALEGALKLKEITYIHAEGYAAGEMKHGPIALINDGVPVIVIAPSGPLFEKTASNAQEVIARGGRVILLTDKKGSEEFGDNAHHTIALPQVDQFVAPILYAVPVQLLAYHAAVNKGTDVDQPRNLAKSVTVE
ncbi:MAG: Glutamine--fructose-6-phosphate aminotransferase [isomerizing] [Alphaproteobacteria bacterium MarineAlpha3_Bin7]|nr:MAG: Glutamine--fructose-6-phosphate aminotransferase [isomerizing] [Alphaproteobacteria bacterium MarineAlpha3_Bin7]